jgi:hypothetical protein
MSEGTSLGKGKQIEIRGGRHARRRTVDSVSGHSSHAQEEGQGSINLLKSAIGYMSTFLQ